MDGKTFVRDISLETLNVDYDGKKHPCFFCEEMVGIRYTKAEIYAHPKCFDTANRREPWWFRFLRWLVK
jgi:hypothetical protein